MIDTIPPEVLSVARALEREGFEAYMVGGSVRDLLAGGRPKDFDLSSNASPEDVMRIFGGKVHTLGQRMMEHGTVIVVERGMPLEITQFRRDLETDGRHATIGVATTIEEDLARRDFTINAIAIALTGARKGELVDPYGGEGDLRAKRLRCVGDPKARFSEDALRIMRAYRFSARYSLDIEEATRAAMRRDAGTVGSLSAERIYSELCTMAKQAHANEGSLATAILRMSEDGVLGTILPAVEACRGVTQNEYHTLPVLEHLAWAADHASRMMNDPVRGFWVGLLHDIAKPACRTDTDGKVQFLGHEDLGAEMVPHVAAALKMPRAESEWLQTMVRFHMRMHHLSSGATDRAIRRLVAGLAAEAGSVTIQDLWSFRRADKAAGSSSQDLESSMEALWYRIDGVLATPIPTRPDSLPITGHDVMQILGIDPGPKVGEVMRELHSRVIDDPELNDRQTLMALVPSVAGTDIPRKAGRGPGAIRR